MTTQSNEKEKSCTRINLSLEKMHKALEWALFAQDINPCDHTKAVVEVISTAIKTVRQLQKDMEK